MQARNRPSVTRHLLAGGWVALRTPDRIWDGCATLVENSWANLSGFADPPSAVPTVRLIRVPFGRFPVGEGLRRAAAGASGRLVHSNELLSAVTA